MNDTWGYIALFLGIGAFVAYAVFLYFSNKRGEEFDYPIDLPKSYKDDE